MGSTKQPTDDVRKRDRHNSPVEDLDENDNEDLETVDPDEAEADEDKIEREQI